MAFSSLEEMAARTAEAVRPTERLNVKEWSEKYRRLNNPGSYVGPFKTEKAPYMAEPMETLTSRDHTAMIFAGPARTGKSDVIFNWVGQTAHLDPMDMVIIHMTQSTARDWSQGDLKKFLRDNPSVDARVAPGRQNTTPA